MVYVEALKRQLSYGHNGIRTTVAARSSLIRIPVPLLLTMFADNGHDGIRTHDRRIRSPTLYPD